MRTIYKDHYTPLYGWLLLFGLLLFGAFMLWHYELLQQLKMVGGKGQGLLMLDRELSKRQFVDETQEE